MSDYYVEHGTINDQRAANSNSGITNRLDALHKDIEVMFSNFEKLEVKLTKFVMPDTTAEELRDMVKQFPISSETSQYIDQARDRIQSMTSKLATLADRLDT